MLIGVSKLFCSIMLKSHKLKECNRSSIRTNLWGQMLNTSSRYSLLVRDTNWVHYCTGSLCLFWNPGHHYLVSRTHHMHKKRSKDSGLSVQMDMHNLNKKTLMIRELGSLQINSDYWHHTLIFFKEGQKATAHVDLSESACCPRGNSGQL